jgi:hypothetical protein
VIVHHEVTTTQPNHVYLIPSRVPPGHSFPFSYPLAKSPWYTGEERGRGSRDAPPAAADASPPRGRLPLLPAVLQLSGGVLLPSGGEEMRGGGGLGENERRRGRGLGEERRLPIG